MSPCRHAHRGCPVALFLLRAAAGLTNTLSSKGTFTLFAPTNFAFDLCVRAAVFVVLKTHKSPLAPLCQLPRRVHGGCRARRCSPVTCRPIVAFVLCVLPSNRLPPGVLQHLLDPAHKVRAILC